MVEDLFGDPRSLDDGEKLHAVAAARAGKRVDPEGAFEEGWAWQGASEVFRSRATFAWAEAHVRLGRRFVATDALAELASRMPAFEYGRWILLLTLALDATVDSCLA